MILITYWYDVPEILETGAVQKRKNLHPQLRSLVLENVSSSTTVGRIQQRIYQHLRVPPSHQALEQCSGKGKATPTGKRNVMQEEENVTADPTNASDTLAELGIEVKQKSYSKSKLPCTFHLRTRISVHDYAHVQGKFYKKFNQDGTYHRDTVVEALSNSFTSQLILYMWKKHWITRFVLICFILVALLSLYQSLWTAVEKYGYEL